MALLRRLFADEEGADATEYALMVGLIALAIVAGATALGGGLNTLFTNIANYVKGIAVP